MTTRSQHLTVRTAAWAALILLAGPIGLTSRPAPARPWWEGPPLRIIDLAVSGDVRAAFSPEALAAFKAGRFFNLEHFGSGLALIGAVNDQGRFEPAEAKATAYLREYLTAARRLGLRTLIYFNVHAYPLDFGRRHPDWAQLKPDGTPISNVYETNTAMCYNTGYREWCFQMLRNIARLPVDGVFYDGPIFYEDTCYCRACRAAFQKRYGRSIPSKAARSGRDARDLLDFQAQSLRDFLRDSRRALKAVNPEAILYMNGGERGENWRTGRLNRVLAPEQDLLGSEGGFLNGDLNRTPIWKPGVTARWLETLAEGKPRVIFSAAGHKPWTFSLLPAPELRLLYAQSIAQGAGVWFGAFTSEFSQPEMDSVTSLNRFLSKNSRYFEDTKSDAATAVVWSEATADFYPRSSTPLKALARTPQNSEVGNPNAEFSGLVEALLRSRTPFDVIDETRLEQGNLGRYKLIILPNTACMSEKTAAGLEQYVRQGGALLATFETSLYDDSGLRRKELLLGRLLGVRSLDSILGPRRWDYVKKRASSPFLAGLDREFLPSTLFNLVVEPTTAGPLLQFTEPLKGRYDGVPALSVEPALLVNSYGKGRVLYCPGDLGASIQGFRLPEHLRLVENIARALAPCPVRLEGTPGYLDLTLRSQGGGRKFIHLINFTGEMTRPMRRIVPLKDVSLTCDEFGRAGRVFTLVRPQALKAERSRDGSWQVTLPSLEEYEVIVIEK